MCVANSRIFVQEGIYDKFVAGLTAAAGALKQGDGFSASVGQGPLVSQAQLDVRIQFSPPAHLSNVALPISVSSGTSSPGRKKARGCS